MRLSLFSFNLLALGALVVPALLIYGSVVQSSESNQVWRDAYLGSLGLGVLFLLGAMAKLCGAKRSDAGGAITFMLLGLALVAVPLSLVLTMAFR